MHKAKYALGLSLICMVLFPAVSARAASSDFKNRSQVSTGATVNELAVSNDRFVITLDKAGGQIKIIDTWNWRALNPTSANAIIVGNTVTSMAINPGQDRLYFSFPSGGIKWMDISPLSTIPFNGSLSSGLLSFADTTTTFSGGAITKLDVIQDQNSSTVDCVFAQVTSGATTDLQWVVVGKNAVRGKSTLPMSTYGQEVESSGNDQELFTKFMDALGNSQIYRYQCDTALLIPIVEDSLIFSADGEKGLGVDQSAAELVFGDTVTKNMILFNFGSGSIVDFFPLSRIADRIWVKDFMSETNSMVFFSQGDTLNILPLSGASKFGGTFNNIFNFAATPMVLASSSSADGYLYVGDGSTTVKIVTPNPMVYNLATNPGGTIETKNLTLSFQYDSSGRFFDVAECRAFSISPSASGCSRFTLNNSTLDGSGSKQVQLSAKELGNGKHVLGVFVQDASAGSAHQGRNAIQVSVSLPPPVQKYSLDFGDQKIIISFRSPDISTLSGYTIFYGTNNTAPPSGGTPGDPASPINIHNATPNHDYRIVVDGLTNGIKYYAQIKTVDSSGKVSFSEIKSTVPQPVETFSDKVHEKGGCMIGSSSDFSLAEKSSQMALLFCPLISLLAFRIKLRRGR